MQTDNRKLAVKADVITDFLIIMHNMGLTSIQCVSDTLEKYYGYTD